MDAAVMPTFVANAVRLQLDALAYNLGNFMRTVAMPGTAQPWSLTSLREKLIKIGAKVVTHGRYVTFQMAEVAVPRQTFAEDPVADCPAPSTARAGMSGWQEQNAAGAYSRGMRWCGQNSAVQRSAAVNRELRSLVADARAICRCPCRSEARSWPQNRRESGECRLNGAARRRFQPPHSRSAVTVDRRVHYPEFVHSVREQRT